MKGIYTKGFTFVEILVVVAVIAVITTIIAVSFQRIHSSAAERIGAQEVRAALSDARNKTLASSNDTVFGVRISSTTVTLFEGFVYSSMSASNTVYTFTGGVTATTSLSTGWIDIVFNRLLGEPSATGTIDIVNADNTATTTITVHGSGLIES